MINAIESKRFNNDNPDERLLVVKVIKADYLQGNDNSEYQADPYCVVKYADQKAETNFKLNTLNPVWNQEFIFKLQDDYEDQRLTIDVLDKDIYVKSDYL